jgi:hypothetical protein
MNRLIVPEPLAVKAKAHLFQDDSEHFAFFLCTLTEDREELTFNADEIILVDDENLAISGFSLEMQLPELIRIMNTANDAGRALVEAHNHPRGFNCFSYTDLKGFDEFVPYVLDTLRRPYGATVWDDGDIIGVCWKKDVSKPEKMAVVQLPLTGRKAGEKRKRGK